MDIDMGVLAEAGQADTPGLPALCAASLAAPAGQDPSVSGQLDIPDGDLLNLLPSSLGMEVSSTYPRLDPPTPAQPADSPAGRSKKPVIGRSYAGAASATKTPPPNVDTWRREWYTTHQRAANALPEELILQALQASPQERRALVPSSPCAREDSQEFWIPAANLTQAFPLEVIMNSLFEFSDPAWLTARPHLFGFAMVRGKGVQLFTNNLEISGLLRNLVVNICGYDHIIHAPSLIGQFYWVQLHRVPTAITPLDVFDFFENRGCSPMSVFPTISAGTLHSNSLKVIFNSKQVPGFLWSQHKEDEPLREIILAADICCAPVLSAHRICAAQSQGEAAQISRASYQGKHPTIAATSADGVASPASDGSVPDYVQEPPFNLAQENQGSSFSCAD
ncbi:hypothetical protein H310_02628 [Aphanomyces invadans]|uniref:Uncharacterized protein n=1 Tax=Aphanomyces invadans TaxID=157072 RepID=A0A024UL58_9STRA|nr:hypothetical protein H310_02628 [Aphanomyces invadans]ETW06348.1 hypothetical protein H310_02628 [Aphanomyces invadans]|eukprot:XP_008864423.1 hypothetical protein H310_02628 [Aphanomyces invadans]